MFKIALTFGTGFLILVFSEWICTLLWLHFGHKGLEYLVAESLISTATALLSMVTFSLLVRDLIVKKSANVDIVEKPGIAAFVCFFYGKFFILWVIYPHRHLKIDSVPFDLFLNYFMSLGVIVFLISVGLGFWVRSKFSRAV